MSVIDAPAPTETEVTTRDVLHRAADLLEEFGWCQGTPAKDASCENVLPTDSSAVAFCALGALYRASVDLGFPTPMSEVRSWEYFPISEMAQVWDFRWGWNDEPGRTKEAVVARLRAAAEAAQDEGAGT